MTGDMGIVAVEMEFDLCHLCAAGDWVLDGNSSTRPDRLDLVPHERAGALLLTFPCFASATWVVRCSTVFGRPRLEKACQGLQDGSGNVV